MSLHQHAKIFDLKILPADWLRAFWPISLESNFSQMLILYRNIANNINFNHIPNAEIQSQEILMIKFFNNFKTTYLRQNFFFLKIWLSRTWISYTMIQFKENAQKSGWEDGRTDRSYFTGSLQFCWGSKKE